MDDCFFNPFQPSVGFHIETNHLICSSNQITGFYMKFNTRLKWVDLFSTNLIGVEYTETIISNTNELIVCDESIGF